MSTYLNEAFQKLDLLESEDFDLYDQGAIDDLSNFKDEDETVDLVNIIDDEAETDEDLADSYVGKVILECNVCHALIYKDRENIEFDEECDCVNKEEECPVCFSNDGFSIVGQVEPYEEVEVTITDKEDIDADVEDDLGLDADAEEKPAKEEEEEDKKKNESLEEDLLGLDKTDRVLDTVDNVVDNVGKVLSSDNGGAVAGAALSLLASDEEEKKEQCKDGECCDKSCDESLKEDLNNIELDTEDQHIEIKSTPKEDNPDAEMIAPIDDETMDFLASEDEEEPVEEEPVDGEMPEEEVAEEPAEEEETVDYPVDEFDEESFDELGESYLKKVYENVNSYKTTKVSQQDDKLFVEGLINFKSGNTKKTSFIFEAKDANREAKVRFIGENAQITRGRKAFTVAGTINEGKFIAESLNYNYRQKNTEGVSSRVYGTVKLDEGLGDKIRDIASDVADKTFRTNFGKKQYVARTHKNSDKDDTKDTFQTFKTKREMDAYVKNQNKFDDEYADELQAKGKEKALAYHNANREVTTGSLRDNDYVDKEKARMEQEQSEKRLAKKKADAHASSIRQDDENRRRAERQAQADFDDWNAKRRASKPKQQDYNYSRDEYYD